MKDPIVRATEKSKSDASVMTSGAVSHHIHISPSRLDSSYPTTGTIELWCGSLAASEANLNFFSSLLNAPEKERAARFKRVADADKFSIARGTLRSILGAKLNANPASIAFETGKFGKPQLKKHSELQFNLSHSEKYMILALSVDAAIGVDVEQHDRTTKIDAIAKKHFSESENSTLQLLIGQARLEQFFSLWTKKEAVVKALGTGISRALTDLPNQQELDADGWVIQELDTSDLFSDTVSGAPQNQINASAAVAIKSGEITPNLKIHRWDWT